MKVYEFADHEEFESMVTYLSETENLLEVYSFLPEDEIIEKLRLDTIFVPLAAVLGALGGAIGGFLLQYIPNVYMFPMNISGKPLNSWPAFLPITFEMSVLTCAFFILISFILVNRLPRFDRGIYALSAYNEHRHDRFFIVAKKEDPHVKALAVHDLPDSLL